MGGSDFENALGIAVDSAGSAYIVGWARSRDFPTTQNSLQPTHAGGDACVVPPSAPRVTPCNDVYVSKLNPEGSELVYSTYLGGSGEDSANAIALDSAGNAYLAGETNSLNFPTQNPLQPIFAGGPLDAFVAKLNPDGSALVYSTYLGGGRLDRAFGIALDSAGNAYVAGPTNSTDFPTTKNALQTEYAGGPTTPPGLQNRNAFVTKIGCQHRRDGDSDDDYDDHDDHRDRDHDHDRH